MRVRSLVAIAVFAITGGAQGQEPKLTVLNNADAGELIIEIGPLHLEAQAGHDEVAQPQAQAIAVPISAYLHGFTTEMLDAAGNPIPSFLLHHVNIIAPQRRELFSEIMQRVGAAGSETGPVLIPKFVGYPIAAGDSLLFTAMFHNPTNESYHNARLRLRMRYSSAKSKFPRLTIQPFYLDVMPPAGGHSYDLPPGRSTKSWEGKPAVDGRILGMGGHLHKYGLTLRLEDVTENKVLFESEPELDEDGNVVGMPQKFFFWRLGSPIKASNTYRLTAIYDNPTGETLIGGGMGALGGIFVPSDPDAWPPVNRHDPEYQHDVKVTYEGSHGGHGAGHGGGHSH